MSHSTCLSSAGAYHLFRLCYGLIVSAESAVPLLHPQRSAAIVPVGVSVHATELAADAEFYVDLDPQLHLLWIYVRGDLSDTLGVREKKGDTVIPPL